MDEIINVFPFLGHRLGQVDERHPVGRGGPANGLIEEVEDFFVFPVSNTVIPLQAGGEPVDERVRVLFEAVGHGH